MKFPNRNQSTDWKAFRTHAKYLGVDLSVKQFTLFQIYDNLLLKWNKKINLVSRKDIHRILSYHFVDSLVCNRFISEDRTVCDLGSGAGFPGIPLSIIRDDLSVYLVESIRKKALFLREVKNNLNLHSCTILNQRAEDLERKFDVIVVRLLGGMRPVLEKAMPLLEKKGKIMIYKSGDIQEEMQETKDILCKYKGKLRPVEEIPVPGINIVRKIVIISSVS